MNCYCVFVMLKRVLRFRDAKGRRVFCYVSIPKPAPELHPWPGLYGEESRVAELRFRGAARWTFDRFAQVR